jgi:Lrp/AsnC family transcriptional regulator, regulator for asnA, asnC and gidA
MKECLYKLFNIGQPFQGDQALSENKNTKETVDSADNRILRLLQRDCRQSFGKVAEKAGVSVGTAYNRVKSLEARGFVKGYTLRLDSTKLGYTLSAVIFVQADGKHLAAAEREIALAENVLAVYDITGEFDAVIIAKFKDREKLNAYIKQIASHPHIKRTATSVSLNVVKEDFDVDLPQPKE